jgi:hypothetical protein
MRKIGDSHLREVVVSPRSVSRQSGRRLGSKHVNRLGRHEWLTDHLGGIVCILAGTGCVVRRGGGVSGAVDLGRARGEFAPSQLRLARITPS